jgi:hypothetical protein
MIVKLKDEFDLDKFLHISFGAKGNECISYREYFSTENLRKPTTAKVENNSLIIDVIEADGSTIEIGYDDIDGKTLWEVYGG